MKTQSLSISDTPSSTLDFGIGFNWFDFLGSGGLYARNPDYPLSTQTYPALEDSADWSALLGEFDRLNPGFIRFGIPPDRILDAQGNLIRDSLHFTHLDRVAGWCAEHGATVILDPFVIPERFEFDPPAALVSHMTNMAARDNRAYAREFVAPLLQHVVVERGLGAIRSSTRSTNPFITAFTRFRPVDRTCTAITWICTPRCEPRWTMRGYGISV